MCFKYNIECFEHILQTQVSDLKPNKRGLTRPIIWKGPEYEIGHVALNEVYLNNNNVIFFAKAVKRIYKNNTILIAITDTPFEFFF